MANVFHADRDKVLIGDGKFDSRRRFLRVVATGQDCYLSTGPTFAHAFPTTIGNTAPWRYRNGPYAIASSYGSPPALADTSIKVKF